MTMPLRPPGGDGTAPGTRVPVESAVLADDAAEAVLADDPDPDPSGTPPSAPDFDEFYAANFARLVVGLQGYTGDPASAQDLAQEALCRALLRWRKVSRYDDPVAWVRRVAWNLAANRWQRLRIARRYASAEREQSVAPPSPDRVAVDAALSRLPARQRRVIALYYLADLSVPEIAAQDGVPEGTVRSLLHRGRAALAVHLSDLDA